MKHKYKAVYKCPLCGELVDTGAEIELEDDQAAVALGRLHRSFQFNTNPYIPSMPEYVCHFCNDGSVGLANFAGLRRQTNTDEAMPFATVEVNGRTGVVSLSHNERNT